MREKWRLWKENTKLEAAEQQDGQKQLTSQLPIDYNSLLKEVLANPHPVINPPPPKPLKNKSKPQWAYTSDQREELEDKEADDLIAFMDDLDIEKYREDVEVRNIVSSLKKRIDELHETLSRPDAAHTSVFHSQARMAHNHSHNRELALDHKRLPSKDGFGHAVASSQKRIKSGVFSHQLQQQNQRPQTAAGKQGTSLLTDKLRTLIVKRIADAILKSDAVASVEQAHRSSALECIAAEDDRRTGDGLHEREPLGARQIREPETPRDQPSAADGLVRRGQVGLQETRAGLAVPVPQSSDISRQ